MTEEQIKQIREHLMTWKTEHQEEYNRFAQHMDNCEDQAMIQFYRAISAQSPDFIKKWELCYNDDTREDFEEIKLLFKKEVLPKEILKLFQEHSRCTPKEKKTVSFWWKLAQLWRNRKQKPIEISAPMIYTWLFFGKSFESMVKLINKQLDKIGRDNADAWGISAAVESIIISSIKSGFRTREQWEKFFALENAIKGGDVFEWAKNSAFDKIDKGKENESQEMSATEPEMNSDEENAAEPLENYIKASDKNAILDIISEYLRIHRKSKEVAVIYYALKELNLLKTDMDKQTFGQALYKQFASSIENLKKPGTIRQSVGDLETKQEITKNGKTSYGELLDDDKFSRLMTDLMEKLSSAIDVESGQNT